ncbi:MAG: hypothetical protein MH137_04960 [Flavobacteriales bacterium]|nr:hypothetical protein [Flavobacteriales bacterium]
MEAKWIEKEEVHQVKFPTEDVLLTSGEKEIRFAKLEKAMLLGNGYKAKVKIVFQTTEGLRKVETTVWEASENQLMLKGDVLIPIHAIVDVEL